MGDFVLTLLKKVKLTLIFVKISCFAKLGVLAVEMETAGLYMTAAEANPCAPYD